MVESDGDGRCRSKVVRLAPAGAEILEADFIRTVLVRIEPRSRKWREALSTCRMGYGIFSFYHKNLFVEFSMNLTSLPARRCLKGKRPAGKELRCRRGWCGIREICLVDRMHDGANRHCRHA